VPTKKCTKFLTHQNYLLFYNILRFLKSAQWFLLNQDKDGRWTTPISHKIANTLYLDRNWPSAMAQGHALSVLTRAYNLTRDQRFIESARKALLVFSKVPDSFL
jgi:heparosan-N-sulfate-glucuronate 5-epimerase